MVSLPGTLMHGHKFINSFLRLIIQEVAMKTYLLPASILIVFTFFFISFAQESYFGVNEGTIFVEPKPAQGNSAGIEYGLEEGKYVEDLTKKFTISYDSDINKIIVVER